MTAIVLRFPRTVPIINTLPIVVKKKSNNAKEMSVCWPVSQTTSHTLKGQKKLSVSQVFPLGLKKISNHMCAKQQKLQFRKSVKNSTNLIMVFHFIHSGHTAQSWASSPRIPPKEHYKKCESQILMRSVLNYYGELW